jgi:TonB dependent receptor
VWSPTELEGFQISGNFNRTRFYNQIQGSLLNSLGTLSRADALAQPALFPMLAVRGPDGTLLRIENSAINLSSVTVRSVDFNVNYDRITPWGAFNAVLQGSITLSYDSQLLPLVPVQDLAGTTAMDKRRAALTLGWSRGAFGANVFGNYTGPYLDTEIINLSFTGPKAPAIKVPSRVTWDFSGFYNAPWGIKLSGGVKDAFGAKFPFAQGDDGPFDSRRLDFRGRVVHVEFSKSLAF